VKHVPIITFALLSVGLLFTRLNLVGGTHGQQAGLLASAQLADLKSEVEALRSKMHEREDASGGAERAAATSQTIRASAPVSEADALAQLDTLFAREHRDRGWAESAEAAGRAALSRELSSRSRIESLECRTRMCKGSIVHLDAEAYSAAVKASMTPTLEQWPGIITYVPPRIRSDGKIELILYLFREAQNPMRDIYGQ
jgi:hypothetical protein